jgi:hypothetical protein
MDNLTDELRRLRENDPDLAHILDTYAEIRRIYGGVVEATRFAGPSTPTSSSSAKVSVSAQPTAPLSRPIPSSPR